ncbi:MAG: energy-coupling factor ABC transporter substrate-binding protein [Magnetococcales bacterium]|nr:energy-coupling factor ABC transporter substrate-binding protein [Magnetococcales bacterium]
MTISRSTWLLLGAATIIIATPLFLPGVSKEFKGADDLATEAIQTIQPGYKPWFTPFWTPPSCEVENMMFAIQGGLGAGILGYVIGRRHAAGK